MVRILVVTYKVLVVVLLMNTADTADVLLINSLALIFILDLDFILYAWGFDKKKSLQIECMHFLVSRFLTRLQFELQLLEGQEDYPENKLVRVLRKVSVIGQRIGVNIHVRTEWSHMLRAMETRKRGMQAVDLKVLMSTLQV
jgi:hypothetical protein